MFVGVFVYTSIKNLSVYRNKTFKYIAAFEYRLLRQPLYLFLTIHLSLSLSLSLSLTLTPCIHKCLKVQDYQFEHLLQWNF